MAIELNRSDMMGIYARNIIHTLIMSSIISSGGIKLSLDTPPNNTNKLNILLLVFLGNTMVILLM